jgi:hypothetical protein
MCGQLAGSNGSKGISHSALLLVPIPALFSVAVAISVLALRLDFP